jgi:phage baseplate assembly protein W
MSRADKITVTSKKSEYYADFLMNFDRNPISGELARVSNEKAVIRSIRNLLLTNRGERLFDSSIGSNIKRILFEPADSISEELLKSAIQTTIEQHEPRAALRDISVTYNGTQDTYIVNILLALVNDQSQNFSFSTVLRRVR